MNGEDLFRGLNYINDKFVDEAETSFFSHSRRKCGLTILIAAIISLLSIVALATTIPHSPTTWFFSFFGDDPKQEAELELTENQSAVLDAGLVEINQSVTHNGYTITLESGICDGNRALIKCRVDAPAGVSLNGSRYAFIESSIEFSGGDNQRYSGSSYTGYTLEDDNPYDNSVTQLLDIFVQPSEGSSFSMADGSAWRISFSSISELSGSGENIAWNTLCEGTWEFEVIFEDELLVTKATELLHEPVKCLWSLHIRSHTIPLKTKVLSFEMRSLTATIRFKRPFAAVLGHLNLDESIYLVLKDGSKVRVNGKMVACRDDYNEMLCFFDRPVSVEDVEYIAFPGTGTVEVIKTGTP